MTTPRAALPELSQSQSLKEVTHNMALRIIEALCVGGVESLSVTAPPGSPTDGQIWIVGTSATGAWAGQDKKLAHFTNGAWAFYAAQASWNFWVTDIGMRYRFDGTNWVSSDPVQEGLAATGNSAGTAATVNVVRMVEVVSSTTGSADGIKLPAIVKGKIITVFNKTANTIKVYPPAGMQINFAGANIAHTVPAFNTITYYAAKDTSYYS